MARRWFGFRDIAEVGFTPPLSHHVQFTVPLSGSEYEDGDTIVRTLFGWRAQTVLTDESPAASDPIRPAFVALAYSPDPDGEPEGGADSPGGALLCREMVGWEGLTWTDGLVFNRRWFANSYKLVSGQGQRKIVDKSVAQLELSFAYDISMPNLQGVTMQSLNTFVVLWAEWLVQR